MKSLLLSWCTLLLMTGTLVACTRRTLVSRGRGYEVTVRQAEEPTSTMRDIDAPSFDRDDEDEAKPKPVNFRRKRLQLRRNRYLLLQEEKVED